MSSLSSKNASNSLRLEQLEHRLTLSSPGSLGAETKQLIASYYETALHRTATGSEVERLAQQLDQGASLGDVVGGIVRSAEALSGSVAKAYQDVLGRSADAGGLGAFVAARSGWMSHGQLLSELLGSAEAGHKLPDSASFVKRLYQGALGREGSAAEVKRWVSDLDAGRSRADVSGAFVGSDEFHSRQVNDLYRTYLGRSADAEGLQAYTAQLKSGKRNSEEVGTAMLASAEFGSSLLGSLRAVVSGIPSAGREGTAVTLGASVNSAFLGVRTYAWQAYRDGVAVASGSASKFTFTPDDNGSYVVELRVRDWLGRTAQTSAGWRVDNVAPSAGLTGPSTGDVGASLSFSGSGSDPGRRDEAAGLTYAWDFGDGGRASGAGVSHSYAAAGTYVVTLTTRDKDGDTGRAQRTVTVTGAGPTASFSNSGAVNEGGTGAVAFGGQAGGNGGYTYSYDFDNDGRFEISDSASALATVPASYLADGPFTRVVGGRIKDGAGRYRDYTTSITVRNVAPTGGISGPSSGTVGATLSFTGTGDDASAADRASLTYAWDFGDGARATGVGASHAYAAAGTYVVRLTVTDKDGGSRDVTRSVVVSAVGDPNDPLNKPVLSESSFTYLGSFAMPRYSGTWDTAYTTGGLTHRYVDGELRFLTTAHAYSGGEVYEVAYTGLGTDTAGNVPQARLVQNWGDVYGGHKWVGNEGGTSNITSSTTYGLYYDENLDRLYWSYGNWYNATNPYNPSFGYSTLDDTTGVATGVGAWSLVDRPEKFARGGTLRIPQWFADRYTDGKTLGVGFGGYFSIVGTASFGPALAAVSDPDVSASPDRSALDNVPLIGYPSNAPDRAHRNPNYTSEYDGGNWNPQDGTGYWTWSDTIYGGATWIDTPQGQGVVFLAKIGEGRVWYESSDRHAEGATYEWFVYSPKDLADVATGVKQQWEIQPMYSWLDNGTLPGDPGGYSGDGIRQVGGATYDANTGRMYVLVTSVDSNGYEAWPRVYAYQVG